MRGSVPSARYSSICNVLRQWKTSLIPIYRVYRLYDNNYNNNNNNYNNNNNNNNNNCNQKELLYLMGSMATFIVLFILKYNYACVSQGVLNIKRSQFTMHNYNKLIKAKRVILGKLINMKVAPYYVHVTSLVRCSTYFNNNQWVL